MTTALDELDAFLRPGAQSIGFHTLRCLGRAEAIRQRLAKRPPPPEADALLCVALACLAPVTTADAPAEASGAPTQAAPGAPTYNAYTLVDQAVEAAKRNEATRHQASFINGCLRRFLREQASLMVATDHSPQAVWNHPQWWIDRMRKDHPGTWQTILVANNAQAPLILRVNKRKTSQAEYLRALEAINLVAHPVGDAGVILACAHPVTSLPGFAEGHFSVQDAAAQLAAPLLLAGLAEMPAGRPPKILDACAAPGGKTAHLLELTDGHVTALDIDAQRCRRIAQNLNRLGLAAEIIVGDAGQPDAWWDGVPFDAILLDAPCTASGIVRRHPDVRWLRRPGDIAQLAKIQAHLLQTLWTLLKPGGRLVYCTCSVFHAEGQEQVQTFLAHHTDARSQPSPGHMLPQTASAQAVFPDNLMREHDGFFYAVLEKRHD